MIRRPSGLKGIKVRAANTPIELARGANPVLAYNQVFTAMQQGTVDGEILRPIWYYTDKHYEVAKNYDMLWSLGAYRLYRPRFFNDTPKDVQDLTLRPRLHEAEDLEWDQAGKDADSANAKLKAIPGIEWFEPTGSDLADGEIVASIWDPF